MEIDTLILSGGSVKGISFLGSINYLVENNILNFNKIKKIHCVSAGALFIISLILLNYDYNKLENDLLNIDFNDILNINDISLKNFINEYGFVNYSKTYIYIQKLLIEKYNCESMSLYKFYKLFGKHLIIKVVNISQGKIEYIDHINNPKINILKLIQMTTAIPLLIKPIKYKENLYLDGGLCGNSMNEFCDENCLSIEIFSLKKNMNNFLDYIWKIYNMYSPDILIRKYNKNNIKIQISNINIIGFDMNIETKKLILKEGYEQTKNHFNYLNHL